MSFRIRLHLIVSIISVISLQYCHSKEFPTDNGSVVLTGSYSTVKSNDAPYSYYDKKINFSGSLSYILFPDLSVGLWSKYEKISSGSSYRTDQILGPQLTWFIGGHRFKSQIGGKFYQYAGLGVMNRRWEQKSLVCDSTGCRYEKSAYSSGTYRLSFGLMIMINNHFGVFGEAAAFAFARRPGGGDLIIEGIGHETTLDFGLILFLY